MSVTILQEPQSYAPGFGPLIVVGSSDQIAQPNFRYRVRIKTAVNGTDIATFAVIKRPDNSLLLFDAQRVVENFLTYDTDNLINTNYGFKKGVNVFKKYAVNVMEEYGTTPALHASGSTANAYAFNGAFKHQVFRNWNYENYLVNGTGFAKFLTNQPERIKIRTADSYELGMFQIPVAAPNKLKSLKIEPFDSFGNAQPVGTIDNPETANTADDARFMSILCGPADLNASTLSTGSQPIIKTNTAYYRVSCVDNTGTRTSEYKYFDFDTRCSNGYIRLYWLNPFGRIDGFNFIRTYDQNTQIERSSYDKPLGEFNGNAFSFPSDDSGSVSFHNRYTDGLLLRSDFLTEDESAWLKGLVISPMVLMVWEGEFIQVNVQNATYEPKKYKNQKLFKLELIIKEAIPNYTQRL